MNNLYDALEICLQEIEKGSDLEAAIQRFPALADELRPILQTSLEARSIMVTGPDPDVVRRGRARVLQQAAHLREARTITSRRTWSVPLRRMLVSMAVIAALFITSTGLVRAASTTLPGDNLYPVKRTWEDIRLLFTFNLQARQALEVEHENERLEELYELFAAGRLARVDFAGTLTRQNGDLWLVSKVPVVISAQTDLRDQPIQPGDAVRVRGMSQPDGTVLAERVDRLSEGTPLPDSDDDPLEVEQDQAENENEAGDDHSGSGSGDEVSESPATQIAEPDRSSREGIVDSINGNILVVNGQPMNMAGAEVRGTPAVGASVKVEGYFDASGLFIVTRIEFRSDDSGSENNSNSNDNNNDDDGRDDNGDDNNNDDSNDDHDDNSGKDENNDDSNDDNGGDDG
jgi:hypothetical protein